MADWKITARTVGTKRFELVDDDQWQGPAGASYLSLAGLEEAHGPSKPVEVANVHELLAELDLTAQACDRAVAERDAAVDGLADTRLRLALAWKALRLASRVVAGEPRRCPDHGAQFTRLTCCAHPQLVARALDAVAAAMPRPAARPTDLRGDDPAPTGAGNIIEKEN